MRMVERVLWFAGGISLAIIAGIAGLAWVAGNL